MSAGVVALAGLALICYANRFGADVSPDSAEYISGGIRLAHGEGCSIPNRSGPPIPLTWFPPLFPLVIAGAESLRLPLYKTIGFFNAGCFATVVLTAGLWVWRATGSRFWSAMAGLSVLTNQALYSVNSVALSEPLFLLCMMGFLWCLIRWRQRERLDTVALGWVFPGWVALAGIFTGAGMLTRYAGLCLLPAGGMIILLTPRVRWLKKLIALVLLGGIGLAPSLIWSRIHTLHDAPSTSRAIQWHPITGEVIANGMQSLAGFLIPDQYSLHLPVAVVFGLSAALFFGCCIFAARSHGQASVAPEHTGSRADAVAICIIFICTYLLFLITSISFVDGTLDDRFLSVVAMPMMVVICIGLESVCRKMLNAPVRVAIGIFFVAALGAHAADLCGEIRQRESAEDLAWYPALQSDTLDALRDIPAAEDVWSDRPYAIYMAYRLRTDEMPNRSADPSSDEEETAEAIDELRDEMNEQGGGWIVFWHQLDDFADGQLTENDVRKNFVVTEEDKYEDGVIMRIDDPPSRPSTGTTTQPFANPATERNRPAIDSTQVLLSRSARCMSKMRFADVAKSTEPQNSIRRRRVVVGDFERRDE